MNVVEPYIGACPYDEEDECAKFTIDDVTDPFVMYEVATVGLEYTFSFWVKSEASATITACDNGFQSSTDWIQHSVTFIATSTDLSLTFDTASNYYIYHPQLEIGNKTTDWTPNPEDVDATIADGLEYQRTEILETSEGIFMSALKGYVNNDTFEEYKTSMDITTEGITMELGGRIDETNENLDSTKEELSSLTTEAQDEFANRKKYITYDERGITLHSGDGGTRTLRLDNKDGVVFKHKDQEKAFGTWDGNNFYTGNIVIRTEERAQFGNFGFIPRSDGSLCFLKVNDPGVPFTTLIDGVLTLHNTDSSITLDESGNNTLILDGVTASIGTDDSGNNTLTIGG